MTTLLVDMNYRRDSLGYLEFVKPILSVVEPIEPCVVVHYLDLETAKTDRFSRIILSGTALKDFHYLSHPEKFSWIPTSMKPVLGICAGMQTILKAYGVPLTPCLQVGMTQIQTTKANPLFSSDFQAYALHSYAAADNETFTVIAKSKDCIQAIKHKQKLIYGLLFHPEVRNPEILRNFMQLC